MIFLELRLQITPLVSSNFSFEYILVWKCHMLEDYETDLWYD
jgi:hypothetical protein